MLLHRFKDFACSNSYLEIISKTLCSASIKQMQSFNQNMVFFIECHIYKHSTDVWCMYASLLVLWENAKQVSMRSDEKL